MELVMKKNLLRSILLLVYGVLTIAPNLMSLMPTLTEQSFNMTVTAAKNIRLDLTQPYDETHRLIDIIYGLTRETLSSVNRHLPTNLLSSLTKPKHIILEGHKANIHSIMQYDNGTLASASEDFTIKNWNSFTGECTGTIVQQTFKSKPVIQLKNGTFVIAEGNDLQIIDADLQKPNATVQAHTQMITSLALLKNGNFASSSNDFTIKIWDAQTYKCIQTLTEHTNAVTAVACLKNGTLISSSADCTIKIWNPVTYQSIKTLMNENDSVTSVIPLKNGNFASVSNNIMDQSHYIKIWDAQTYECIKTLIGHTSLISSILELHNGNIASASWDKTIRIWNLDPFEIGTLFAKNKSREENEQAIQSIALILQLEHIRKSKEYQSNTQLHNSWLEIFKKLPVNLKNMYMQHFSSGSDQAAKEDKLISKKNKKRSYKII